MDELLALLVRHGYLFLPIFVFLDQIGLPLPAAPVLLAAGALAGLGQLDPMLVVLLVTASAIVSDLVRFQAGRYWGGPMLGLICRVSLEPDSCVRRTEEIFARHGMRSLLWAKFVPGLNAAAPTLAGLFGTKLRSFMLFDAAGALIWTIVFVGSGFLFSRQLERLAATFSRVGASVGGVMAGALLFYLAWKYLQRRQFLADLRIARISPDELRNRLDAGEDLTIVDLRHQLELDNEPTSVPGAIRMSPESLDTRHREIPRDRDVILLCN